MEGRVWAALHYVDPLDPLDPGACAKVVFRRRETLLFAFVTSMERNGSDEVYPKVCKWLRRGVSSQVV